MEPSPRSTPIKKTLATSLSLYYDRSERNGTGGRSSVTTETEQISSNTPIWNDGTVLPFHLPLKLIGFSYNRENQKWDAVEGINLTLGLPIIRVSVDHGTAFDQAGTGEANELSLLNSLDYAIRLAAARKTRS